MAETLSVVIASKNCVDRIEGTIKPWSFAKEILVADQFSTDGTAELAEKLGAKVFRNNPPGDNFDLNRKMAIEKATGHWILYIDTDERPSEGLITEIRNFLIAPPANASGIKIPNEFYFLGKPLKHGIYNSNSAEIRMFRRGKWHYPCEDGYHRGVSVKDGNVIRFRNAYKHFNVNSLSEWFIKTNQYTELDASAAKASMSYGFISFLKFFMRHYFIKLGFLDGRHGFLSIVYFGLYHFTLTNKSWEKRFLSSLKEGEDYLKPIAIVKR